MNFVRSIKLFIIKHFSHERRIFYVLFGNVNSVEKGNVPFSQKQCKNIDEVLQNVGQIIRQSTELKKTDDFKMSISLNVYNDNISAETNNHIIELSSLNDTYEHVTQSIENWDSDTKKEGIVTYYEQNKDKILKSALDHYNTHKEDINKRRKEKLVCDVCGGHYTLNNKAIHFKTKKHQKQSIETEEQSQITL